MELYEGIEFGFEIVTSASSVMTSCEYKQSCKSHHL
jgi:hypothetical protein